MRSLTAFDYLYILLSGLAGVWEAWCLSYGRDSVFTVALPLLMGLPFAVASYAHDRLPRRTDGKAGTAQVWKQLLVLGAGMPVSFICGALSAGAVTALLYAIAKPTFFPLYLRFSVGVAVACFTWTCCIRIWLIRPGMRLFDGGFFRAYLALIAGTVLACGLWALILYTFHKDLAWFVDGAVITGTSAVIIAVCPNGPNLRVRSGNRVISE